MSDVQEHLDPVCGMTVTAEAAAGIWEYKGQPYYFCHPSCLERFKADPGSFLAPAAERSTPAAPQGTEYICPMDPEVRQNHPGACPTCGMALEPDLSTVPATRA